MEKTNHFICIEDLSVNVMTPGADTPIFEESPFDLSGDMSPSALDIDLSSRVQCLWEQCVQKPYANPAEFAQFIESIDVKRTISTPEIGYLFVEIDKKNNQITPENITKFLQCEYGSKNSKHIRQNLITIFEVIFFWRTDRRTKPKK